MEQMTLRQWRGYREKTQTDMAKSIGVSLSTYRRYEECVAKVQVGRLCKIADVLRCGINDIKVFVGKDSDIAFIDKGAREECEESS